MIYNTHEESQKVASHEQWISTLWEDNLWETYDKLKSR